MRILMLGNSFTFVNNMPDTLAAIIGAEVMHHTRGGARLAEHFNPVAKMGKRTQDALLNKKWDYVILQEMSNGPSWRYERFFVYVVRNRFFQDQHLRKQLRLPGGDLVTSPISAMS